MGQGVLIHHPASTYSDAPGYQYQFPKMYLSRMKELIGNWVLYYEPVKVPGTRGYYGVAKVASVRSDPSAKNQYLAEMVPGTYLEFPQPVPYRIDGKIIESGLLNEQGDASQRRRASVRPISGSDFSRIVDLGLGAGESLLPRVDDNEPVSGFSDRQTTYNVADNRERETVLASRLVRDRAFRQLVVSAYDARCAMTGLRLINGGGRAEVQAAHIRPVQANGPDSINNGIALSGTVHWMFDRGLISLDDDLSILISRQANDPDGIRALINKSGVALTPRHERERPHPQFLHWHREHCFKH